MCFRSIALAIVMAAVLSALAGCGTDLKISNGSATQEGVTVTLEKAAAQKKSNPSRYEYSFSGTIENNSDVGVMRVIYTFSICDKDGEEFRSFGIPYDGVNKAIPPHGVVSFSHDGIKWGAQSVPASVSIGISSVQTEDELPPAHVPQKGEYLYEALGDDKLANVKQSRPQNSLSTSTRADTGARLSSQAANSSTRPSICSAIFGSAKRPAKWSRTITTGSVSPGRTARSHPSV